MTKNQADSKNKPTQPQFRRGPPLLLPSRKVIGQINIPQANPYSHPFTNACKPTNYITPAAWARIPAILSQKNHLPNTPAEAEPPPIFQKAAVPLSGHHP